ncbi:arylsulfatase [Ruania alba]|uniref:Arylsulfatase n=1 Tax=Ruania alba TaxID=648782 RepID=A0A1H5BD13_9MICO|nr:arylsulfatase [Ruania alba]SED52237.1 arylsulfatase [Ruania alba]
MNRPDVLVILADDMGFSDIGCYGGEIETPVLDGLARRGTRFTQFYNSPRCSPTRASLLTGLHPHQVGIGILTGDERPIGYRGDLAEECHTVAELLRDTGYGTYLSGKWHLSADMKNPSSSWPNARGFERTFGTIEGAGSFYDPVSLRRDGELVSEARENDDFYYTDAIGAAGAQFVAEHARDRADDPLFLYLPFTAPHWPLHAREEDVERYCGRFDTGWDELRAQRRQRLIAEGILDEFWPLSERDPEVPAWEDAGEKEWQARRMEVYAAQVSAMDRAIGAVVDALEAAGRLENTLILFLSDNGGCAEGLPPGGHDGFWDLPMIPQSTRTGDPMRYGNKPQIFPGPEDTYASYGPEWANLSNTPFREYKHWVHEGGIATPLIAHWPAGLGTPGDLCRTPAQLVDLLPTILDATAAEYPLERDGHTVPGPEGATLLPALRGHDRPERPLFWEHEGNAAVRSGRWKLARKYPGAWELYDLHADRTEIHDLATDRPELVAALTAAYEQWARRVGVIPRENIVAGRVTDFSGLPCIHP